MKGPAQGRSQNRLLLTFCGFYPCAAPSDRNIDSGSTEYILEATRCSLPLSTSNFSWYTLSNQVQPWAHPWAFSLLAFLALSVPGSHSHLGMKQKGIRLSGWGAVRKVTSRRLFTEHIRPMKIEKCHFVFKPIARECLLVTAQVPSGTALEATDLDASVKCPRSSTRWHLLAFGVTLVFSHSNPRRELQLLPCTHQVEKSLSVQSTNTDCKCLLFLSKSLPSLGSRYLRECALPWNCLSETSKGLRAWHFPSL